MRNKPDSKRKYDSFHSFMDPRFYLGARNTHTHTHPESTESRSKTAWGKEKKIVGEEQE